MIKERSDAEKTVKPPGKLAKFGTAVKELFADDLFSDDEDEVVAAAKKSKASSSEKTCLLVF